MNKKTWEKPEVKILDVKKDTKLVSCVGQSGQGGDEWHWGWGNGAGHGGHGNGHGSGHGSGHGNWWWPW